MFPTLQFKDFSPKSHTHVTGRSFSLSKRRVPRPLVISELGQDWSSPKAGIRTPHLSFSLETSTNSVRGRFRSPYIFSKVSAESEKKAKDLLETRPDIMKTDFKAILNTESTKEEETRAEEEKMEIPEIRTVPVLFPDICPACGLSLSDAQTLDQLFSSESSVIQDIKYSLQALRLLQILSFELNPTSRELHHQLLQQIKYAVFPLEENGKFSSVSYFSIYMTLDAERKQLRGELEIKKSREKDLEIKLKNAVNELTLVKSHNSDLTSQFVSLQTHSQSLSSEMTRLTTAFIDMQSRTEEQEQLSSHLACEIKVKSRVFTHKERAHFSLEQQQEQRISDLQQKLKFLENRSKSESGEGLEELKSLKTEVKRLNCDLLRLTKLHEVMRKCYEKDMKTAKDYEKERTSDLRLDEGFNTVKFLQRVKKDLSHYQELSRLIGVNVLTKSFDEVTKLTATVITANFSLIADMQEEAEMRQKQFIQLEVSKQALAEEMNELKSRLRYTEMYEENFQLRPTKTDKKFVGLGKTLDVPRYLRVSGFVPNLGLSKDQIEAMVAEIWDMKQQWSSRMRRSMPMHIFLYNYLRNKFNYFPKVAEFGYNLMDGAEKYSESPDCDLFLSVLKGELPESAYLDNVKMIHFFQGYLQKYGDFLENGEEGNGSPIGEQSPSDTAKVLSSDGVLGCVQAFFPIKSKEDIDVCKVLLDQDIISMKTKSAKIPFNRLFPTPLEKGHFRFVEALRKQALMDLSRFYTKISEELVGRGSQATETVSVLQVVQVISGVDQYISQEDVVVKLAPVLGSFLEDLNTPLGIEYVLRKLKAGYIRPTKLYDTKAAFPILK